MSISHDHTRSAPHGTRQSLLPHTELVARAALLTRHRRYRTVALAVLVASFLIAFFIPALTDRDATLNPVLTGIAASAALLFIVAAVTTVILQLKIIADIRVLNDHGYCDDDLDHIR